MQQQIEIGTLLRRREESRMTELEQVREKEETTRDVRMRMEIRTDIRTTTTTRSRMTTFFRVLGILSPFILFFSLFLHPICRGMRKGNAIAECAIQSKEKRRIESQSKRWV